MKAKNTTTPANHQPTSPTPADDLLWTAFQYSVGELPSDEADRFEARLETDAAAQRALTEAVALHEGVRLAEKTPAETPAYATNRYVVAAYNERATWRTTIVWSLLTTAASLALWFGVLKPRSDEATNLARQPIGEAQRELAMAWIAGQAAHEELALSDDPANDPTLRVELLTNDDEALVEVDSLPAIAAPTAPDWLIAALVDAETSPLRGEN